MKVSVSIPTPVLKAAKELANQRKMPISQLCVQALNEYVARHAPDLVTAQLNRVYASQESKLDSSLLLVQVSALED